jgi:hypothetical protein
VHLPRHAHAGDHRSRNVLPIAQARPARLPREIADITAFHLQRLSIAQARPTRLPHIIESFGCQCLPILSIAQSHATLLPSGLLQILCYIGAFFQSLKREVPRCHLPDYQIHFRPGPAFNRSAATVSLAITGTTGLVPYWIFQLLPRDPFGCHLLRNRLPARSCKQDQRERLVFRHLFYHIG